MSDTGNGKIWFYYGLYLNHYQIAVPVVVVFTKCDALQATGFVKLKQDERKLPAEEQFILVKEYVKRMLRDTVHIVGLGPELGHTYQILRCFVGILTSVAICTYLTVL